MAKRVAILRSTTSSQADLFVGRSGELFIDLEKKELRIHDGIQTGGYPALRADLNNVRSLGSPAQAAFLTALGFTSYGISLRSMTDKEALVTNLRSASNAEATDALIGFVRAATILETVNGDLVNAYVTPEALATTITAKALLQPQIARSSNTQLGIADLGKYFRATGSFTQTVDTPANLTAGWWCYYQNAGTGIITIPSSDGRTNWALYPNEVRMFQSDGVNYTSQVIAPFLFTADASGSFIKPPGYLTFAGHLWAGGGSGGKGTFAGGGGGGACVPFSLNASVLANSTAFTIAAGGAAQTTANTAGNVGGNSQFDTLIAYGGGGGGASNSVDVAGGGGGGAFGTGSTGNTTSGAGGKPVSTTIDNEFGGGTSSVASGNGETIYGGGCGNNSNTTPKGTSVYGGGGGGGLPFSGAPGTSMAGGSGGNAGLAISGTIGVVPAGGGGATQTGPQSGAGASGRLRIWGVV